MNDLLCSEIKQDTAAITATEKNFVEICGWVSNGSQFKFWGQGDVSEDGPFNWQCALRRGRDAPNEKTIICTGRHEDVASYEKMSHWGVVTMPDGDRGQTFEHGNIRAQRNKGEVVSGSKTRDRAFRP